MHSKRTARHHVIFAVSALAAVTALVLSASTGHAATTNGRCTPSKVRFSNTNESSSNTTSTPAYVSGATTTFVQGGTSPGCVILNFSAQTATGANTSMVLRPLLDGAFSALPGEVQADYSSGVYTSKSVNFIFPNVAPGSHRIRIQFWSTNPGNAVSIKDINMIIHHAP